MPTTTFHDAASCLFAAHLRKPKRIRTAFSQSQLLRLEAAFKKYPYVVGQERTKLALSLNLSETQVRYVTVNTIIIQLLIIDIVLCTTFR